LESSVENYFEYRDTQEDQKFKVAKVKLTKLAATWLEGIQRQRVREGKTKINTWEKLKKILRRKYVPSNYTQQLSMQWSTLSQGNKTVAQYIQEWERLSVLCDVRDSEDMRVGKFLGGLREDLRITLTTIPHLTVALAGEQAML
jgi:retrotransposon gag protein